MDGLRTLQWYDYIRLATVIISVLIAWRISHRMNHEIRNFGKIRKLLKDWAWFVLIALFFLFEACLESIAKDTGWAWRIPVQLVLALSGLYATRKVLDPSDDYSACGFVIQINDTVSGYCDKKINEDHMHSDGSDLHHLSLVYTNSGRLYQG